MKKVVRRRGYGVRVRGRVFQKNTKQLLKQKEVFTWPHVLRDLRVKTGPDERDREVRTRHIIYIYAIWGSSPAALLYRPISGCRQAV